ncbi:MAG: fibronectin type III domain-containing protein, partial [Oscillospiraceae bacterium]
GTEEYDFQWQFAYWDTTVNGNTVPVLGYVVTDPVAPPSPPSNLYAENIVADSFKLNWTAGSRPADEYRIYRVLDDTNAEPVQVATVDGTKTDCTLSSLRADTTYTYIVKAYAAPGEGISSRGLSVASESLTITTPPEGAEAPTISGPGNVGAKVGGTASFTVNVVLPDKYGSVSYQWQQRKNASGWSKVSDSSIGKTLTLTHVTEEMDGTEYRCALTASYADGSPTYYYSGVGKLTVGRTSVSAALGIKQAIGGTGPLTDPYTGAANYQKETGTETKTVQVEKPEIIANSDSAPELTVYQVGKSTSAAYVGIGTADGITVYYAVTKSGESYTVGAPLTLTQYEYLKIDKNVYDTMPTFDSTKPVSKEKDNATYLLMATVTGG